MHKFIFLHLNEKIILVNGMNRLKDLREDNDLKQENISSKLNMTRQNYSRWETGEQLPPLYHLNTLANLYNVNMDYIMGLTNKIKPNKKIKELDYFIVGKHITEIRKDNNLSMRALALILNTTHSTLSVYESGKNLIIISFALELSKKFNISLDWLCGRSDEKYIER